MILIEHSLFQARRGVRSHESLLSFIQCTLSGRRFPPGGRFGPRVQQDYQLVLLHTGQMTVYIDDVPHHVQPGHAVLLKLGHVEHFYFAKQQETWHRWIAVHLKVDPDALSESTSDSPLKPLSIKVQIIWMKYH
ncbi:AraC family ligand binding domain-containing protein [Cohnella silvisoli]|uniref:AraC family ligand binding domain-containing protein n=1 Tax=Cohnella silvisoli TaxID=2873699 RepID=A0ABV1L1S6_9BACL|nr:AraC family ligand binding domain-containing protein [Cohnella silvisoli]MCD9025398.1 AraC family ligand binding domain-containing protein [Cohnella silvisoli]